MFSLSADIDVRFAWLAEFASIAIAVVGREIFVKAVIVRHLAAGVRLDTSAHLRLADRILE